jgi:KDO2-lipid IV(A) lauroyltransferase
MDKAAKRESRRPFETAAFRAGLFLIPRLPRRAVLALAWLGGNIGFLADARGRRIGRTNLNIAFGDTKTTAEKRAILRTAYVTMTRTLLDVIWFGTHSKNRLQNYVEIDSSIESALRQKSQIWITAHFGNWEIMGQMTALHGFPMHSIAMPVKNPEVNQLLIERREITGQTIIPRKGALRKLLGILRNGGKAAFLVDQNTKESEGGIWVNYFGLPVPVTSAPAMLAAKTGSEILIGFCIPLRGGRYRVYMTETIPAPASSGKETVNELTQHILTAIETEVTRHPEYWLWMYNIRKAIKPGFDRSRYPRKW